MTESRWRGLPQIRVSRHGRRFGYATRVKRASRAKLSGGGIPQPYLETTHRWMTRRWLSAARLTCGQRR